VERTRRQIDTHYIFSFSVFPTASVFWLKFGIINLNTKNLHLKIFVQQKALLSRSRCHHYLLVLMYDIYIQQQCFSSNKNSSSSSSSSSSGTHEARVSVAVRSAARLVNLTLEPFVHIYSSSSVSPATKQQQQ